MENFGNINTSVIQKVQIPTHPLKEILGDVKFETESSRKLVTDS